MGLAGVAVSDGLSLMSTAFDGVPRGSVFGNIGGRVAGENGQIVGDFLNLALGLKDLAGFVNSGRAGQSGLAVNGANLMLSSILPDWMKSCQ